MTLARKRFKFIALSEGKDLQPRRLPHRDGGRDLFRHQLHRITIKGATAKLREPSRSASLKAPTTIVRVSGWRPKPKPRPHEGSPVVSRFPRNKARSRESKSDYRAEGDPAGEIPVTRIRRNPAPTVVLVISMIAPTGVALCKRPRKHRSKCLPARLSFAPVGSGRMSPYDHSAAAKWALRGLMLRVTDNSF